MPPIALGLLLALTVLIVAYRYFQPFGGVIFDKDDAESAAATKLARETLPDFWTAFHAQSPTDTDFALKFDLNHDRGLPDRELIWAEHISLEGGIIRGKLGNHPINADFQIGDDVQIDPNTIFDWCFFRNGVAHGHHHTRLMMKYAPARDVRHARRELGW